MDVARSVHKGSVGTARPHKARTAHRGNAGGDRRRRPLRRGDHVEETKTTGSRRSISIPLFLVELLEEQRDADPDREFLFVTENGDPIRRSNFRSRCWKPSLRKAVLDEGLRFHDLRHTCASLLIEQGAHPKEIQARLGHSSITTTLDRYGHLMPCVGHQLSADLDESRARA